jgi:hypothetical protein
VRPPISSRSTVLLVVLYLYPRRLGLDIDGQGVGLAEAMKMAASSPESALTNGRVVFSTLHAYRLLDVRWQYCAHTIVRKFLSVTHPWLSEREQAVGVRAMRSWLGDLQGGQKPLFVAKFGHFQTLPPLPPHHPCP